MADQLTVSVALMEVERIYLYISAIATNCRGTRTALAGDGSAVATNIMNQLKEIRAVLLTYPTGETLEQHVGGITNVKTHIEGLLAKLVAASLKPAAEPMTKPSKILERNHRLKQGTLHRVIQSPYVQLIVINFQGKKSKAPIAPKNVSKTLESKESSLSLTPSGDESDSEDVDSTSPSVQRQIRRAKPRPRSPSPILNEPASPTENKKRSVPYNYRPSCREFRLP